MPFSYKSLALTGSLAVLMASAFVLLAPVAKAEDDVWPKLKQQTFGDRAIKAEDGAVVLEIPGTAEDASLVPLTVRVPPEVAQGLKSLTLIIDKNPNPLVAALGFGPAAGSGGERSFSTRVRIDMMSGTPARPFKEWARELAAIRRLAKKHPALAEREN
jgi:sulfur-oxidizing protein SoxY